MIRSTPLRNARTINMTHHSALASSGAGACMNAMRSDTQILRLLSCF